MKYKYIIINLVAAISLGSCSDWFDVSPKTDVKADELFETENGFMSALAGIYISMTDDASYGGNMSFGMIDQLAQIYDMVPNGANNRGSIYIYDVTSSGFNTKAKLADSWKKEYNLIANVNNLIKWFDKNGENAIREPQTRNMIKGEALAIRAYLHFDLLRGWGPMYKTNPDDDAIPYREIADNSKQPLLSARKVLEKIIADLKAAEELLKYESTVSLTSYAALNRQYRFNYFAVKALEARVYGYAGDAANAISCAHEVINNSGLKLQSSNQDDPVLFSEALCALNMNKMSDRLSSHFAEGSNFTTQYYCTTSTLNTLFESTGSSSDVDIRAKSSAFIRNNDSQQAMTRKYIKNDNMVIPLIRLPEMYYILCEMSSIEDAPQYINNVRNHRGYSRATNYATFSSDTERINALDLEYRKEFYAEGQYFFFLKSHAFTTFTNCPIDNFGKAQYVFPLPDAEKEYGWTPAEEEGTDENEK